MYISSLMIMMFSGIIAGIITGLIPGVHINLITTFFLTNLVLLQKFVNAKSLVIFIISMGVIHTFVDFIPSIIFGVPNEDTALSILPGHKMVLNGQAFQAIFLSSLGSLFGMVFAFFIMPLFFFGLKSTYEFLKGFIPYLLIFTIILLIFLEPGKNGKFWAFIIVLFSGSLGMLTLNTTLTDNTLMVLFTGLFGVATILYSLKEIQQKFPKQNFNLSFNIDKNFFKAIFVGGISSTICSVSPGIGNAQAGTVSALFFKNLSSEIFIVVLSSINTINFILGFVAFYIIEKTRNGSVFAISQIVQQINFYDLKLYFAVIFLVSVIGFFLTLFLGKHIIKLVGKFNFKMMNISVIVLLFIIVFIMTNIYGILILTCAAFLGVLSISLGVRRVHLMGVLLIPIIINLL